MGDMHRSWRSASRMATAGVATVALIASCGVRVDSTRTVGGTRPSDPTHQRTLAGQVVPASFASKAVAATTAQHTARFTMTVAMDGGKSGADVNSTASGAFDLDTGSFELDVSAGGLGGQMQLVVVGGKAYLKVPKGLGVPGLSGKPWVGLPGLGAAGSSSMGEMDPGDMLARLKALTGGLTVVGHETVDGVDTTHYRGTIDPSDMAARSRASVPPSAPSALRGVEIPVDLWIDGQGLLRRQRESISAAGPGRGDPGAAHGPAGANVTVTMDFTDFGRPVSITAPPADQVMSLDPSALAGGLGAFGAGAGQGGTDS